MEIVPIFADDNCLLTVRYDDENADEFTRLQDSWTDVEYLENFFSNNANDLNPYWDGYSVDKAVFKTIKDAGRFFKYLKSLSEKSPEERKYHFSEMFYPLINSEIEPDGLQKKKAYGSNSKSWLRIYALKVADDMFLVTGGAIKLTATMGERDHTQKELQKIERCKQFLIEQGVIDEAGMVELLLEID